MTDINLAMPKHIAVIMDGNGRWAKQRKLPRIAGHKEGAKVVRRIVRSCVEKKIEVLTLFAFSSENWKRPLAEVSFLMDLFVTLLRRETRKLHEQNIQLHIIGDRSQFDVKLQHLMQESEQLTAQNTGLKLVIAANYGGRWDITQTFRKIAQQIENGQITHTDVSLDSISSKIALANLPDPDLLIRTSGEQRISNFLLWQLAHTKLYFTQTFWPDFDDLELGKALEFFAEKI